MNFGRYGDFASIVAIASSLVAVFSIFLLKAVGSVRQWTSQIGGPKFMVTVALRGLAVALIAMTYLTIDETNYLIFGFAGIVFGILAIILLGWFDLLRRTHVHAVKVVGPNGQQARNWRGKLLFNSLVIGTEANMEPNAKAALNDARAKSGGVSLGNFMAGFGGTVVNDPAAIWSTTTLAGIGVKMMLVLIGLLLCAVMALYLSAAAINAHQHVSPSQTLLFRTIETAENISYMM